MVYYVDDPIDQGWSCVCHMKPRDIYDMGEVIDTSTGEVIVQKLVAYQIWHLEKAKKVLVEINGNGQGNDDGSNLLVRFLGQLAQKQVFCPIQVERWDSMPEANSIAQWNSIEEKFEFDYAAGIKWVWSTLGERWKAYKYKLRCERFYPNKSKEEILANPPPNVNSVDWAAFVHHYMSDHMKKQSKQNTKNRKKLEVTHGSSKSNARLGRHMELQLGRPVCRGEIKLATLLKKDGSYVNQEGKAMADKISENLSEDQERAATIGIPSKILVCPDDAIGKAYGAEHSGRVRCLGPGACPTTVFGTRNHFANFVKGNSSQEGVEDLKKQVETLEQKLTGYEDTKKQLAILQNFLQHKFGDELSTFSQGVPPP